MSFRLTGGRLGAGAVGLGSLAAYFSNEASGVAAVGKALLSGTALTTGTAVTLGAAILAAENVAGYLSDRRQDRGASGTLPAVFTAVAITAGGLTASYKASQAIYDRAPTVSLADRARPAPMPVPR